MDMGPGAHASDQTNQTVTSRSSRPGLRGRAQACGWQVATAPGPQLARRRPPPGDLRFRVPAFPSPPAAGQRRLFRDDRRGGQLPPQTWRCTRAQ